VLGVPIRVLDDTGQSVPAGAIGTVYVGGRLVFGGYTGGGSKPAVDGLLSTGDRGHFDDAGCLYIDGRADDMIVSGGENVYPLEVENLLAAHPGVAEAAVIGVPDPEYGQRLAAFVVPRTAEPGADELRAYVRKNLARYQTPRDVVFLAELPRNAAGKILRSALAEQINKP
jgi:fatty-acyl-CoA synthase